MNMNLTNPWALWVLIILVWAIIMSGGYLLIYGLVEFLRAFV